MTCGEKNKTKLFLTWLASPRFPLGAGVAAAAVTVEQIAGTLGDMVSGVGLQAEASARHSGRLVHGGNVVLPLKL